MEKPNFNSSRYRENLAKDLKNIHREDSEKAWKILDEERQTMRYKESDIAYQEKRLATQEKHIQKMEEDKEKLRILNEMKNPEQEEFRKKQITMLAEKLEIEPEKLMERVIELVVGGKSAEELVSNALNSGFFWREGKNSSKREHYRGYPEKDTFLNKYWPQKWENEDSHLFPAEKQHHDDFHRTEFNKEEYKEFEKERQKNNWPIIYDTPRQLSSRNGVNVKEVTKFIPLSKPTGMTFIKLSPKELGFDDNRSQGHIDSLEVRTQQIYDKAQELGLKLCPQEVAFEIANKYKKDKNSDKKEDGIIIGSKALMSEISYTDWNEVVPAVIEVFKFQNEKESDVNVMIDFDDKDYFGGADSTVGIRGSSNPKRYILFCLPEKNQKI